VTSCAPSIPIRRRAAAFTLMEALLATIIVGTAVLAIVAAQQAYHQQNGQAQHMGAALLLANEIREMTMHLPLRDPITSSAYWGPEPGESAVTQFDDLDDFDGPTGDGLTISPPVDATGRVIPDMTNWSQVVTVHNVLESFINASTPAPAHGTDVVRITCDILYQDPNDPAPVLITRLTWIRAR
jgi:hypothetical protein